MYPYDTDASTSPSFHFSDGRTDGYAFVVICTKQEFKYQMNRNYSCLLFSLPNKCLLIRPDIRTDKGIAEVCRL